MPDLRLLPLLLLLLFSCSSREDRVNSKRGGEAKPSEYSGAESDVPPERIADFRGNRLLLGDDRELVLVGLSDNRKTESYLREAFANGELREPVSYTFDSDHEPRRPERAKTLNVYVNDATGTSVNGSLIRSAVSPFVRELVTDSTYRFEAYAKQAGRPAATSTTSSATRLREATFQVLVFNENNQLRATGSGFFVSETGVGLSNYHVFEGGSRFAVQRCSDGARFAVTDILDYDDKADYIAFHVDGPAPFAYLLPATETPEQGDQIYVYGSPKDLNCSLTRGIVSALRGEGDLIQIDAAISSGNSGSPVTNEKNEVIGIATFKRRECENCNFAMSERLFHRFFNHP